MNSSHHKLRASLSGFALAIVPVVSAAPPAAEPPVLVMDGYLLAQGGEAGEGEAPSSYRLHSTDPRAFDFDAGPTILNYAGLVYASYGAAVAAAERMQAAIAAFLEKPSEERLAEARAAWVAARPHYLVTEAFRFYGGPIDVDPVTGKPGPESRLNAWPLNEAFIDAVRGSPGAGIVNDFSVSLTRESLLQRDQVSDEADVTTGWHAIEFLLWGQDFNPEGPGSRPHTDYLRGSPATERRRLYLRTVTEMLVEDLRGLSASWKPDADNYRRRFLALEPREALGRVFNGIANLAAHELAIERLSVALDSGDQEDEHSCFSDTTHQDHVNDLRGVRNVWFGSLGEAPSAAGLRELVQRIDPPLAAATEAVLARAHQAAEAMDQPFEKILRAPPGSPPRARAETAVSAFTELGKQFARVGRRLGVLVIVPGLGLSGE